MNWLESYKGRVTFVVAINVVCVNCNPHSFARHCEWHYPTLPNDAIRAGASPYLFGGYAHDCTNCQNDNVYSQFCRFALDKSYSEYYNEQGDLMHYCIAGSVETCTFEQQQQLVSELLAQDASSLLQLTPCDLWNLIRGRTLWFVGDSMTLDLMKAVECFMYEFWDGDHWESMRQRHAGNPTDEHPPSCISLPEGEPMLGCRNCTRGFLSSHATPN